MAHPNRLSNARVLVFGGTSGIGFGVASMALSAGAQVIISGSQQPKVDDKVSELRSFYPSIPGEKISGHALDLADTEHLEANLKSFFDTITNSGENKIDHIAFTAGDMGVIPKIPTLNVEEVYPFFKIRLFATMLIAKLLSTGTYMPLSPSSSYTLTGGTNTKKPMPGWSIPATIGGAIEALSRGLAVDLKPIRVNMVEPGAVQTPLLQRWLDSLDEAGKEKVLKTTSLTESFGQPEDLAEAYGWFMRDRFATGVVASSNGGRMLAGAEV